MLFKMLYCLGKENNQDEQRKTNERDDYRINIHKPIYD